MFECIIAECVADADMVLEVGERGDVCGVGWYVRVDTQAYDRAGFVDSDGSSLVGTATVGERLERPSSAYSRAGYP